MVKHTKAPKTSSKGKAFLKELLSASSVEEFWSMIFRADPRLIGENLVRHLYDQRRDLLRDLANLHDAGFGWLNRKWGKTLFQDQGQSQPSEIEVLRLRDDLRQVWNPSVVDKQKHDIVRGWFHWKPSPPPAKFGRVGFDLKLTMWEPVLYSGKILPAGSSLHAQLVQGVLEQFHRFAICQNPDCPTRYFLAKRSDQKYCERGECTAYAQRIYALGWWNRGGKDLRKRKIKKKTRATKRRKK
jgi:hypothetical protein